MAVKSVKKVKDAEVDTKTKATGEATEDVDVNVPEVKNDVDVEVEDTPAVDVPEVEVEAPEDKKEDDGVEVDTESAKVDNSNKPNGSVKIRMRVDHKCTIAMERYDLKAGKTYVVPLNVKRILNNAGLLAPL